MQKVWTNFSINRTVSTRNFLSCACRIFVCAVSRKDLQRAWFPEPAPTHSPVPFLFLQKKPFWSKIPWQETADWAESVKRAYFYRSDRRCFSMPASSWRCCSGNRSLHSDRTLRDERRRRAGSWSDQHCGVHTDSLEIQSVKITATIC